MKKIIITNLLFLCMIICAAASAAAATPINVDYSVYQEDITFLENGMTDIESLLSECEREQIPTAYEKISYNVLKRFTDYLKDELNNGIAYRTEENGYTEAIVKNIYDYNVSRLKLILEECKGNLSAYLSGDAVNYRADGLIVSTPTGSTAYSMSAGGPIIDPVAEAVCITPICSHALSAKPIILGANTEIKLKAFSKKRTEIFLTVDGRKVCPVKPYTEIYVEKSESTVQLIRINERSFYKTLAHKFADGRSVYGERQETRGNNQSYQK